MRIIFVILASVIFLSGCGIFKPRIEYREKVVPVYSVPAPPKIERPELPIHSERYRSPQFLLNPENIGTIVQDYTITVRLLLNYAQAKEEIIDTYDELSKRDFASRPAALSSSDGNSTLLTGTGGQMEVEYYTRRAFEDIVDKYEERKQEILNDETE